MGRNKEVVLFTIDNWRVIQKDKYSVSLEHNREVTNRKTKEVSNQWVFYSYHGSPIEALEYLVTTASQEDPIPVAASADSVLKEFKSRVDYWGEKILKALNS